eukprot:4587819-Amphidinium_carterae.1
MNHQHTKTEVWGLIVITPAGRWGLRCGATATRLLRIVLQRHSHSSRLARPSCGQRSSWEG